MMLPLTNEQIWGVPESELPKQGTKDYFDMVNLGIPNWCPDCGEPGEACHCIFCPHCGHNITSLDRMGEYCPVCNCHLGGGT